MIVTGYKIDESLRLVPVTPEEVVEAAQTTTAKVWLDLQACEPSELEAWLDKLGIQGLARLLCLKGNDRSGFYPLENEAFLVIPVPAGAGVVREMEYLAILCQENLLLTFHPKPVACLEQFAALLESDAWIRSPSIAGLVSALMIDLSQHGLQRIAGLRNSVMAMEELMDRDAGALEPDEILDMRSELLSLGAVVSDQLPALQALRSIDKPFFKLADAENYMNCALVNLQAADGSLDWLDGRITALRSGFQMHAQDETNRRLNMLTILSAIFNPATLLAGIWGMNFATMPELSLPYAYPAALGLMGMVGCAMYFYFRRQGWFD